MNANNIIPTLSFADLGLDELEQKLADLDPTIYDALEKMIKEKQSEFNREFLSLIASIYNVDEDAIGKVVTSINYDTKTDVAPYVANHRIGSRKRDVYKEPAEELPAPKEIKCEGVLALIELSPLFIMELEGVSAKLQIRNGVLYVLEGSYGCKDLKFDTMTWLPNERKRMVEERYVDENYVVLKDMPFSSALRAASTLFGGTINGHSVLQNGTMSFGDWKKKMEVEYDYNNAD